MDNTGLRYSNALEGAELLSQKQGELAEILNEINRLKSQYLNYQSIVTANEERKDGPWKYCKTHPTVCANDRARRDAAKAQYEGYASTMQPRIDILQTEIKQLLDLQSAAVSLAQQNANLTPEERYRLDREAARLRMEKQKMDAEIKLATEKAQLKARNTKIIVIASSIVAVLITIGLIVRALKKKKNAAAK